MATILNKESRAAIELMVADGIITKDTAKRYFPALKESEDERIRGNIIATIHLYYGEPLEDEAKEMIAWLERRGQTFNKKDIDDAYLKGVCDAKHEIEKQGEQKPAVPKFRIGDKVKKGYLTYTVEDIDEDSYKLQAYSKDGDKGDTVFLSIGYEKDYELVEQNPAENKGMDLVEEEMTPFQKKVFCIVDTAIEEEQGLSNICNELLALAKQEIEQKSADTEKGAKGNDREISNSAWSEEDREYMESLLDIISGTPSLTPSEVECHKDWLKSLKQRYTWKPSNEQIDALVSAIDIMIDNRGAGDKKTNLLSGLYHELKAL